MQYRLRSLMIVLALGPLLLWHMWFTANQTYGEAILVGEFVLLLMVAVPVVAVATLVERRRYLLERDRRQRRRSGLFRDNWPPSP